MLLSLEWQIAYRYLRSRRRQGFISVIAAFSFLGVALGVAALIVVMSVMNGFHKELLGKILGTSGHITVSEMTGKGIKEYTQLASQLESRAGIEKAIPLVEGQAMAIHKQTASGTLVKGISITDLARKPIFTQEFTGNIHDFTGTDSIIIGDELAATLNIHIGEILTLVAPHMTATVMGFMPRLKEYRIIGTFHSGMYQYDNSTILMPLEGAQLFFRYPYQANLIEITIADPAEATKIALALYKQFKGYRFLDWQMSNGHLFNALQIERSVMFLILTLIIVVAAFNIISSLIMLVQEKRGAIAILRTMGLSRASILRIFLFCGGTIGGFGTLAGAVLGVLFSLNIETIRKWLESLVGVRLFDPVIYYLSQLPADVHSLDVIKIIIMALTLSFLSTLYPAWKASKVNPAEILRYE